MAEDAPSKPAVLILGGCGFVGRNLVGMLVEKELCAKIRVVDKTMPAMAFLAPDQKAAFDSPIVEYVQGDLSRQAAVDKAFGGASFQYVFNLTYDGIPFGQADEVYQQRIVDICAKVGAAAAQAGIKRFVDLSTAQVYTSTEKAADESAKLKPWTKQASFKLQAEEALRALGLPLVVLRVATVYGRGDLQGLTPRVICAAVYKHLDEKMKFLWDSKLRINVAPRDPNPLFVNCDTPNPARTHSAVKAVLYACGLPPRTGITCQTLGSAPAQRNRRNRPLARGRRSTWATSALRCGTWPP